jgi:hypothetical protein
MDTEDTSTRYTTDSVINLNTMDKFNHRHTMDNRCLRARHRVTTAALKTCIVFLLTLTMSVNGALQSCTECNFNGDCTFVIDMPVTCSCYTEFTGKLNRHILDKYDIPFVYIPRFGVFLSV